MLMPPSLCQYHDICLYICNGIQFYSVYMAWDTRNVLHQSLCIPEYPLHSRRKVASQCGLIVVDLNPIGPQFFLSLPVAAPIENAAATFALLLPENLSLDIIWFHFFVLFHENQILAGTVIGLKNNRPNFASAKDTHKRVASRDGIFCSKYLTGLLFWDAFSNVSIARVALSLIPSGIIDIDISDFSNTDCGIWSLCNNTVEEGLAGPDLQ